MMRLEESGAPAALLESSPETVIHDFFRDHSNYFDDLELAAERVRAERPCTADDVYSVLKVRLKNLHGFEVRTVPIGETGQALRQYDPEGRTVELSQALDHQNRTFQLAHVLCLVEFPELLAGLIDNSGISGGAGAERCRIELANYFAAALLMPYGDVLTEAERTRYDVDRMAAAFGVSFEQVCHRLTTLQRDGARGVAFFFLRVDKAGNVTKRFNSTSFHLAEHGGACPVWSIHDAFQAPGVVIPQFVELPDGKRYFTISRTTERPVFGRKTLDRRLALALGCEIDQARELVYAESFKLADGHLFSPIGISCHLCPRKACTQRAHQPLFVELPINAHRRGETRYES
jgi:predicted transcriptional regulator